MSTDAQICANRANSQHSTGPKTDDGKAASCQNNFRWGLTGTTFEVLDYEDQEEYDLLASGLRYDLQPKGFAEQFIVEKMAQALWLSKRAQYLQDACLSNAHLLGAEQERKLALFLRYQTTHDRAYHRLFNDLLKLRSERRKAEIGFESQKREAAALALRECAEKRRTELHEFAVLLAEAKAEHQITLNTILEVTHRHPAAPENPAPHTQKAA